MKSYKVLIAAGAVLVAAGAGLVLYPHISNAVNENQMNRTIEQFDEHVVHIADDDIDSELKRISEEKNTDYTIENYVSMRLRN